MSGNELADDVWRTMAAVVFDNREGWKRSVVEATGLPFSRVRVLRRLAKGPMTAGDLAVAATIDAPATSVAVNDLEERGLVVREMDPVNRRRKLISLTEEGHRVVACIEKVDDPAPASLARLDDAELRSLRTILAKLRS